MPRPSKKVSKAKGQRSAGKAFMKVPKCAWSSDEASEWNGIEVDEDSESEIQPRQGMLKMFSVFLSQKRPKRPHGTAKKQRTMRAPVYRGDSHLDSCTKCKESPRSGTGSQGYALTHHLLHRKLSLHFKMNFYTHCHQLEATKKAVITVTRQIPAVRWRIWQWSQYPSSCRRSWQRWLPEWSTGSYVGFGAVWIMLCRDWASI